jgi:DNA gyrase inhibitor GyrI
MTDLEVRIVKLEPMRVASVRCISDMPERDAWEKLLPWAEAKGVLGDPVRHPVYGFNNPSPSPGNKKYGYEFWIVVDPDARSEGEIEVKDVPGGLYAVTRCRLIGDPRGSVPEVWKELLEWVQASKYRWRKVHELEKLQNPLADEKNIVLDLYLPIEQ